MDSENVSRSPSPAFQLPNNVRMRMMSRITSNKPGRKSRLTWPVTTKRTWKSNKMMMSKWRVHRKKPNKTMMTWVKSQTLTSSSRRRGTSGNKMKLMTSSQKNLHGRGRSRWHQHWHRGVPCRWSKKCLRRIPRMDETSGIWIQSSTIRTMSDRWRSTRPYQDPIAADRKQHTQDLQTLPTEFLWWNWVWMAAIPKESVLPIGPWPQSSVLRGGWWRTFHWAEWWSNERALPRDRQSDVEGRSRWRGLRQCISWIPRIQEAGHLHTGMWIWVLWLTNDIWWWDYPTFNKRWRCWRRNEEIDDCPQLTGRTIDIYSTSDRWSIPSVCSLLLQKCWLSGRCDA